MPGMPRSICFHKKAPFVRFRNPVFHTNRDSGSLSYFHFTIYIQCFLNILSAIYQQSSRFSGTNPRFSRDLEQGYAEIMHRWLTKNTRSNTPRLTIGWRLISVFQKKTRKKSSLKNITSEKTEIISNCISGFLTKNRGSFHLCQVTKHEPPRHSNQGTHLANSPCRFPEWSHNPQSSAGRPPNSQRRRVVWYDTIRDEMRWGDIGWYAMLRCSKIKRDEMWLYTYAFAPRCDLALFVKLQFWMFLWAEDSFHS